ncbi:MAG: hypothetical protein AAB681_01410 [Patescibacteria group bacterium]
MTSNELNDKLMKIAEGVYGTATDPDQMPITRESAEKLDKLCSGWLETEFDEAGEPISWAVVMPTQRELADKFLNKEISERDLLNLTEPADIYDAVYIVSVITVPEQRGRGLAIKVINRAINNMPVASDAIYFTWPTTKEGEALIKKLQPTLSKQIKIRE